jgi:hypothetical protein
VNRIESSRREPEKKFLTSIKDLKKQSLYIGTTHFEDENIRKNQHARKHGEIIHKTIDSFESLEEGLLAECVGILYLKKKIRKDLPKC